MSIALAPYLLKEVYQSNQLKGKIIAIDVLPWLYKNLYGATTIRNGSAATLTSSNGVKTSVVKGFLALIKNLKQLDITPIICMDKLPPSIKNETIKKRKESRARVTIHHQDLVNQGVAGQQDLIRLENSRIHVSEVEKDAVILCCQHLGISYFYEDQIQGERAVAGLKKMGLADACLTPDRDTFMYGVDFISEINFKDGSFTFYDYDLNLSNLGLSNQDDLIKMVLCTGSDYGGGLFRVGPKSISRLMMDQRKLNQRIKDQIPTFDKIVNVIKGPIPIDGLKKTHGSVVSFVKYMKSLDFNPFYLKNIITHLF